MVREIPEVVRAAAGLAATVLDEARKLPETLPGLPVRVIGMAMQHAMKVQQQYAGLVARGDELFTGLRGADEPGLATFDDDEPTTGFRDSKFDRADDIRLDDEILDDEEVDQLPADPAADAVVAVIDELGDQVEEGRQSIEELVEESPATADILEEIAIDELVDRAPTLGETAPASPTLAAAPSEPAEPTAIGAAPVDGYDTFSIAQLRGRLRGYALSTVQDLATYEKATRAREPYLRMLTNRLEKLEEQAVESSPLAPRGA